MVIVSLTCHHPCDMAPLAQLCSAARSFVPTSVLSAGPRAPKSLIVPSYERFAPGFDYDSQVKGVARVWTCRIPSCKPYELFLSMRKHNLFGGRWFCLALAEIVVPL